MPSYNTLVVLAGTSLLGAGAGLIGCYAVLRRRALLGDALAHASLPGICLAFLAWGERNPIVLLLGALISGLLGVLVVSLLRWTTRIKEDAAIGIVLGVFFGAGIALWRVIQNTSTTGSKAGLTSYLLGKTAGMLAQDVYLIAAVSAACLLIVLALYKEFKLVAFDQAFARVQGWPALSLDLLLTALVAVVVVIGLQAVGVVLMAAMLIMPGVAARFWTDRLGTLLALSAAIGGLVGAGGTVLSSQFSLTPGGPVIVLVGATVFCISALFAPRRGILARKLADRAFSYRWEEQRVLSQLLAPATAIAASGQRRERSTAACERLLRDGTVELSAGQYRLTSTGRERADRVARGRKLWERFVLEYPELASHYADLDVESVDEVLPAAMIEELADDSSGSAPWKA
jgi:manganese/zinc/iron transport system permease protein